MSQKYIYSSFNDGFMMGSAIFCLLYLSQVSFEDHTLFRQPAAMDKLKLKGSLPLAFALGLTLK
jgi:hypothetical protein